MQIGSHTVHEVEKARIILSNLAIDADGSPHAYAPHDSGLPGLDYLANAGSTGNWYGIACDHQGTPFIQQDSDPAPGYYVSTTALEDPSKALRDPARYVNSETIPFVVIPSSPKFGIVLGDVGFALNLGTGDSSQFVVGDIGPHNQFGEASIAVARNLILNSDPKRGGTDQAEILYIFFTESKMTWPGTMVDILVAAFPLWQELGGITRLKNELPDLDWSKF